MSNSALNNFENDANNKVVDYFKSNYQGEMVEKTNQFISLAFKQNKEGKFIINPKMFSRKFICKV